MLVISGRQGQFRELRFSCALVAALAGFLAGVPAWAVDDGPPDAKIELGEKVVVLPHPSRIRNRMAARDAEKADLAAIAELTAQANNLNQERVLFLADRDRFQTRKAEMARRIAETARRIESEQTVLQADLQAYRDEMERANAEIKEEVSSPSGRKDSATVDRLANWRQSLLLRQASLKTRVDQMDRERETLQNDRLNMTTTLQPVATDLSARGERLQRSAERAYRQLKVSYEYGLQIRGIVSGQYGEKTAISDALLQSVSEQLGALARQLGPV
ncbi:MAG TPA: hypothetical protein VHD32_02890 [Candidatus Didemnitutus sp.]|nr:hypothetical protein [Candidatus Didemnitutus sp.]